VAGGSAAGPVVPFDPQAAALRDRSGVDGAGRRIISWLTWSVSCRGGRS